MIADAPSATTPTDDETVAPVSVAVMGSCLTRDSFNRLFNPGYKAWYRTVLMQNQSSLISLMAEPSRITDDEIGDTNDYDRWNVQTDFSKSFLHDLPSVRPDYLILDFLGDMHFGCLDLGAGRIVTNNRWKLWPTPYYKALKASGDLKVFRIDRDPEAYFARWTEAFDRFVDHVKRVVPDTTVVVHRGRDTAGSGCPTRRPWPSRSTDGLCRWTSPRINALWARLDDYATSSTGWQSIDLTRHEYPTYDGHPWGPYYVHYTMDYYADFLRSLERDPPALGARGSGALSHRHAPLDRCASGAN